VVKAFNKIIKGDAEKDPRALLKTLAFIKYWRKVIFDTIKKRLRKYVITDEEEKLLAFSKVFLNTQECFLGYKSNFIETHQIIGFDINERFAIDDIYVGVENYRFGWIQRIEVDLKNNYATIGHIATDANLTGIGLGKRLALAIGKYLKNEYGTKEIHFHESSTKPAYPVFFTKTLGAKHLQENGSDKWVWAIPYS